MYCLHRSILTIITDISDKDMVDMSYMVDMADPAMFQATMLKKRKHKVKRRNTEPHMQLALAGAGGGGGGASSGVPSSAPHTRQTPLVDLCDSPTHATPVWSHPHH